MKFKDLPEGRYYILEVRNSVYVKAVEDPECDDPEAVEVVHDERNYRKYGRDLGDMEAEFKTHAEIKKERKSRGASVDHFRRQLIKNEPLEDEVLKRALRLVGLGSDQPIILCAHRRKATCRPTTRKLRASHDS